MKIIRKIKPKVKIVSEEEEKKDEDKFGKDTRVVMDESEDIFVGESSPTMVERGGFVPLTSIATDVPSSKGKEREEENRPLYLAQEGEDKKRKYETNISVGEQEPQKYTAGNAGPVMTPRDKNMNEPSLEVRDKEFSDESRGYKKASAPHEKEEKKRRYPWEV